MNSNRIITLACILIILLTACAPSKNAVQTAVAQTLEAQRIPLTKINLDSVLFQSGDLPSQYVSGQIVYQWPDGEPQAFIPDNLVLQKVGWDISQGFKDDYLMVALYESKNNLDKTYQEIINRWDSNGAPIEPAEVGDQATYITISNFSGRALLVYTYCSALVAIDITGADMSKNLLEAFGQRINRRLEPLVCIAQTIAALPTDTLRNTPETALTSVPTKRPTNTALPQYEKTIEASLLDIADMLEKVDGVESVTTVWPGNDSLEIELKTMWASKDSQPDVSFESIQTLAIIFGSLSEGQDLNFVKGNPQHFSILLTTYSAEGDYKYSSLTYYDTLVKLYNKQITYDEWVNEAGAGFVN